MATGPAMRSLLAAIGVLLACVVLAFPARGAGASPETELLQNGSFEQDTDGDGIPDFWRGRHLGPGDIRVQDPFAGLDSFRIMGERGVNKSLRQSIRAEFPKGTVLAFRAGTKAEGASREGGKYALKVKFFYQDGTTDIQSLDFSPSKEGWQQEGMGGNLLKDLKKLIVIVAFNDQTGMALFDDIHAEVR